MFVLNASECRQSLARKPSGKEREVIVGLCPTSALFVGVGEEGLDGLVVESRTEVGLKSDRRDRSTDASAASWSRVGFWSFIVCFPSGGEQAWCEIRDPSVELGVGKVEGGLVAACDWVGD